MPTALADTTRLLNDSRAGNSEARERLSAEIHEEFGRIVLRRSRITPGDPPRFLDIVREAYARLIDPDRAEPDDAGGRCHFYGVAATVVRRLRADRAREELALQLGAAEGKIILDHNRPAAPREDLQTLIAVDEALAHLEADRPHHSQVVELKVFVKLSDDEIAEVLDLPEATVKRDWVQAREHLAAAMSEG